jgi:hypothetical protein
MLRVAQIINKTTEQILATTEGSDHDLLDLRILVASYEEFGTFAAGAIDNDDPVALEKLA